MSIECWGKMPEKGVVFCCNKVRNTYKGIQLYRILVMVKGITTFKDGRAMCPVTVWSFRLTRATLEALRTMTQPSAASPESCHNTLLPPRMWLLNVRERKLSGGGSTRRDFLIGLRVVHHCGPLSMSGFYVTSPRLPLTSVMRHQNQNSKTRRKLRSEANSKKFCSVLLNDKQRISWAKILGLWTGCELFSYFELPSHHHIFRGGL